MSGGAGGRQIAQVGGPGVSWPNSGRDRREDGWTDRCMNRSEVNVLGAGAVGELG